MPIDINRGTTGVQLPPEVSSEIWAKTAQTSAVMSVARQVALPGSGVTIPIIAGNATAEWVAETDEKPVSRPSLANKLMTPYTLAVVVPFSNQFRRDAAALYAELVRRLPEALATTFDATVFAATGAPGSNFDQLGAADALEVSTPAEYAELAAIVTTLAGHGARASHILVNPALHGALLTSTDTLGRPFFVPDPASSRTVGSVFGSPVVDTAAAFPAGQNGIAGDFAASAMYGTVEGVKIDIADQASINDNGTVLHLFQRNMFAVRAEIEVGFIVRNADAFVRLVNPTP